MISKEKGVGYALSADVLSALVDARLMDRQDVLLDWEPMRALEGYLATELDIRQTFAEIWEVLAEAVGDSTTADEALRAMQDLVVYDIPDGTRSTLTVPKTMEVETDAGMYCLAFLHTLRSLGARDAIIMTHTSYNRGRGEQETQRFLRLLARGVAPVAAYAYSNNVAVRLPGLGDDYELCARLTSLFPETRRPEMTAHFLVDWREERFLTRAGRDGIQGLPEVDVVIRHTKLQVSGGWIPWKMHRAAYLYSQNGTLHSNWSWDELVAQAAIALLAHRFLEDEVLTKRYVAIDDAKRRHQLREMNLFQKVVRLQPNPKKLFVAGSPFGLYQFYY